MREKGARTFALKCIAAIAVVSMASCRGDGPSVKAPPSLAKLAHIRTADLPAKDGLACLAYIVWDHEPITDVFLSMGGTGTGTSAFVPDTFREALETRSAALITFDKPGVSASFGDRGSARIEDEPLKRHTQGTLVDCAEQAIRLSPAPWASTARWHLRGHSEGASIALYLMDRLLAERAPEAERVKTLILSGLPLEPSDEIARRQLADKPELARAVRECDWNVMREMGVSCGYLLDASKRPSGFDLFHRLASTSTKVKIRVFQGNDDANAPARFVRQLETWNAAQGHLDLAVRYYEGAHTGTPQARQELSDYLRDLIPSK
jgi:pimeloyl-ACP methyl ester carboxylesterase